MLGVSAFYCLYYLYQDFHHLEVHRLDVSTLFPVGFLLNTISHFIAITTTDPDRLRYFLLLYKPQHLFEGLAIYCVGCMLIIEAMRYYCKHDLRLVSVRSTWLTWNQILMFSLLFYFINNFFSLTFLGALGSAVGLIVMGSIFYLSYAAHLENHSLKINFLIGYTAFLSFYALQTSYLRYEILVPWIAYFFGELVARRKLSRFSYPSRFIAIFLLIVIPPLFTYLGRTRASYQQGDRDLTKVTHAITSGQDGGESVLSRLSYINQLTNVVALVEKKGFYNGFTLSYFGYAFIPRFLWPEKPLIKQGQWFAQESGLAYKDRKGRVNNSINMTVPGEFYLNFGWWGVLIGCVLFGAFFAFLWNNTQGETLASWAFRYYLLFGAMAGLGADLQVVVTLSAFFIIYQVYFWGYSRIRL